MRKKNLGIITCPSGNSMGSLTQMKEKTKKWLDALTSGRLHHCLMWFSVDRQLWPSVKYGLCCSMATLSELELVLLPFYGAMLPLGGIIQMAPKGIRQLHQGFYGAGLPRPGVEAIVEQSNKLLMHYGCCTALGTELQTSIGLLLVELGMLFQPLQLSYADFGHMVTTSWLKQVWEKFDRFKFAVMVHNLHSVFPREGDDWLMARFIGVGYRKDNLLTLKRVRKHQQVLFLSNILGVGGELLDKRYLQKWRETDRWSTVKFPWEIVTEVEMHLWHTAITQVVAAGLAHNRLWTFIEKGHKIWDWRIQEEAGRLYRRNGDTVQVMRHDQRGRYKTHWQS
jgi:hypothetical protein